MALPARKAVSAAHVVPDRTRADPMHGVPSAFLPKTIAAAGVVPDTASQMRKGIPPVKAYEQYGERLAKSQEVGGSGQDEAGSHSSPSDPPEASTPNGSPDSHI